MTINLHLPSNNEILRPTITVIGVGGAGGNAVNNMISSQLEGVNFVVANTDAQALDHSLTERTIQLGAGITKGLGAGANPEVGRAAAEEAREEIQAYIEGSNMVFITAGMGGGTGTGAASVVARIAKEQGILTVAVVTKPFQFEGSHRMKLAESGLKELQDFVDTLIIIPNQNLFRLANERTTFADAFKMADEVLHSGVRGVTDLMVKPGLINLDFADIRTVMREMGKAMMGTGEATGERRAIEAAEAAISNPLLDDVSLKGARALLINITGGPDMTLYEVDEAANRVREEVDPEANIIFGSTFNDNMEGRIRVSVVATGIDAQSQVQVPVNKLTTPVESKKAFAYAPPATPAKQPDSRVQVTVRPMFGEQARAYAPEVAARAMDQRPAAPVQQQKPVEQPVQAQAPIVHEPPPPPRVHVQEYEQQREPASASASYIQEQEEYRMAANASPAMSPRHEYREAPRDEKGFFQRMADVGRALSTRSESGKPEMSDRVQVVQKPVHSEQPQSAPRQQQQGDDQYLDIPAFLRRQAN